MGMIAWRVWRQWVFGPLITVGALTVLTGTAHYAFSIPNPAPIYLLAVASSAFVSGMVGGLLSAALTLIHALWTFSISGAVFHHAPNNTLHLGLLVVSSPAIAVIVGLLKHQIVQARQAASWEEAKFRSVTQSSADAIIVADSRGHILTWNRGAQAIFGYEAAEILNKPLSMIMPERYREAHRRGLERVGVTGESPLIGRIIELHGLRSDGREFPLELSLATWMTGEDRFYGGIIRDVSGRKQAEQALRASEERFRHLIESSIQGVIVHRHFKPLFVNQAYAAMFGYTPVEILALNSTMALFAPQERQRLQAYHAARLRGEAVPTHYEFQGIRKDGSIIWLETRVRVIEWEGTPATQGIVVDITERKRAEEALHRAHDELEQRVQERTAELLTIKEALEAEVAERQRAEDAFRQYAQRLEILHEIDRAILAAQSPEAIAQGALAHIRVLVPCWRVGISLFDWKTQQGVVFASAGDGLPRFPVGMHISLEDYGKRDLDVLRAGQAYVVEDILTVSPPSPTVQALQADGLRSYVRVPLVARGELIGSLNLWSDRPGGFAAEHIDIAREVADQIAIGIQQARLYEQVQRYAAELEARVAERTAQLREVNAELEAFAYSVSHDLRAPLRAMQGFSRALLEDYADRLDATAQDYARRVVAAAQRMDTLIEDLLAYSRLSRAELQLYPVDLAAVVADVLGHLEAALQACRAQVQVEGRLPQVLGHPATLHQVVANLVTNAIKFVAPGVVPQVRLWSETHGEAIRLYVEDNGIGIALEYQDRIFRLFERLDASQTYPGTGIGLATVSKGMERMGGRVGVDSKVGQGSRFWIELPRVDATG